MNRKICPHCKTENPEIAMFCKKCGALFRGDEEIRDTVAEKQKRNNLLIIVICAILLVIAFIIFKAGSASDDTSATTAVTTTASTTASTTAPTTTAAPTTTPTTVVTTTAAPLTLPTLATTQPTTTAPPSEEEIQEICDEFNDIIYNIKNSEYDLAVRKYDDFTININSFSLRAPSAAINTFMNNLIPKTDETYNFVDGVAQENNAVLLSSYIPPSAASGASVSAENVVNAKRDSSGTIAIVFKPDSSTFADGQTVVPPHVSTATDYVDFGNFSLGPVKLTKADIKYPGTTVTAEVDQDGDLKKLTIHQLVDVNCTGGVGTFTADVGISIDATTVYEITY